MTRWPRRPSVWGRRPNLILGDRFGVACERWLIDAATEIFTAAGFVVARNAPFAGGYITQTYGRPQARVHALQIEVDRSLYMDEARIEKLDGLRRGARGDRGGDRRAGPGRAERGCRAGRRRVSRHGAPPRVALRQKRGRAQGTAQV